MESYQYRVTVSPNDTYLRFIFVGGFGRKHFENHAFPFLLYLFHFYFVDC